MGILHDTADAVRATIATGSYSLTIEPELAYDTDLALEDADTLHVDIVPAGLTQEADSRASLAYSALIDVAVRYRYSQTQRNDTTQKVTHDNLEMYVDLLEEISEHLATPANRALTDKPKATWLRNDMKMPWLPQHLREHGQFTGIFQATYYVARDL